MGRLSDTQRAARLVFEKVSGSTPQGEKREREDALHDRMARQKAARLKRDATIKKGSESDSERNTNNQEHMASVLLINDRRRYLQAHSIFS